LTFAERYSFSGISKKIWLYDKLFLQKGAVNMFYRRKILMALIEVFGGFLKRTDCQKLLFLFCQQTKRNYYDFFPYKFGGFSLVAYQDKKCLMDLGFLHDDEDFVLCTNRSFFNELKPKDRVALNYMLLTVNALRGDALIRKVYLEYPEYTSRSTILSEVLSPQEIDQMRFYWNPDESSCLFTLGYQGRTIDSYLNTLISNNVKALVDVRKNPFSMKYDFLKNRLRNYTKKVGIQYFHLSALGIPSCLRRNLATSEAYRQLFEHYQTEILPKQVKAIEEVKTLLSKYKRIALTCFEADYHFCHRHKITEYLNTLSGFHPPTVHL
jgi:hypothetical protein